MTQPVGMCVRVRQYESGNPYVMPERQAPPCDGAAEAMRPFASGLKPGVPVAEIEKFVAEMRPIVTHAHFEGGPVDP